MFIVSGANNTNYRTDRGIYEGKSLVLNGSNQYLTRNAVTPTLGTKATISLWFKKSSVEQTSDSYISLFYAGTANSDGVRIGFYSLNGFGNHELLFIQDNGSSASHFALRVTPVFRDTHTWQHLLISYDSTETTASDRIKIWINNEQINSFTEELYPPLNHIPAWQVSGKELQLGRGRPDVGEYFDGYISNVHFVDGQALMPDDFGYSSKNTDKWVPNPYDGTYGNNGFYLPFDNTTDSYSLGFDKRDPGFYEFTSSGTFTVPNYASSVVVEAWGAGGGGGGAGPTVAANGIAGSSTSFDIISAGGGSAGSGSTNGVAPSGSGGTAAGGDTNTNGNSGITTSQSSTGAGAPNAGANITSSGNQAGQPGTYPGGGASGGSWPSVSYSYPTGGGAGSGAYVKKTYNTGSLTPGSNISVTIGVGGTGGTGDAWTGGKGGNGKVRISVDTTDTPNNWLPNNISSNISDTPVDNYPTISPLWPSAYQHTLASGNLDITTSIASVTQVRGSVTIPDIGKWAWRVQLKNSTHPSTDSLAGLGIVDASTPDTNNVFSATGSIFFYCGNGDLYIDGSIDDTSGSAAVDGSWIEILVDMDSGTITFKDDDVAVYSNEALSQVTLSANGKWLPFFMDGSGSYQDNVIFDFGADGSYSPSDSSYKTLNSANLPEPTNLKPQENANIVLYTGNGTAIGSGGNAITGVGFQPDFTWIKERDGTSSNHWVDTVRGATKYLSSNTTGVEGIDSEGVTSFDSDGITLGNSGFVNDNGLDYWSLNIFAGNGNPVSNTDGSITSSVLTDGINFSIVTYTGTGTNATVGHGLSKAPDLIIVKQRDSTNGWPVYHSSNTSAPETDHLKLQSTNATTDANTFWNDSTPTTSVFSLGTSSDVNGNTNTYVAYCFVFGDVFTGGSYTGNGNADGTFIPTDELLMFLCKRADSTGNWTLLDSVRRTFNPQGSRLYPNLSQGEGGLATLIDFLSSGVKIRVGSGTPDMNASGGTYIWFGIKKNGGNLAA